MISASKDIKDSALASGANDFPEKPFEIEALVEQIERLIERFPRPSFFSVRYKNTSATLNYGFGKSGLALTSSICWVWRLLCAAMSRMN